MLKTSPAYDQYRREKAVKVADWLSSTFGVERSDIPLPSAPAPTAAPQARRRRATSIPDQ